MPKSLFLDLLTAFKQDVVKSRYQSFREILEYCRYSANPVGRLVLIICGEASEATFRLSDAVCTALQLANFWQDVAVDAKKDRIYLPEDELRTYSVSEADLLAGKATENFKKLLKFQVERTREFFRMGQGLGLIIRGRLGVELRLTWLAGMRILDLIEGNDYDVFQRRPILRRGDFIKMLWIALSRKRYERY
jgi:squalene synthase HpnC